VNSETPVYAFLFKDNLILTKRSKADLGSKVLSGLSRAGHKSMFKYTQLLNLSLEGLELDECLSQDNRKGTEREALMKIIDLIF
jgi:hypothetical protein